MNTTEGAKEPPHLAVFGHQKDYKLLSRFTRWERPSAVKTPFGSPVQLHPGVLSAGDIDFAFFPRYGVVEGLGRSYNPRALVFAAASSGIGSVLSLNGVAAIGKGLEIGDMVLAHDFIDLTRRRDSSFLEMGCPEGFVRMNPPFCPGMQNVIRASSRDLPFRLGRGVYACIDGPRFETPAEVSFLSLTGSDLLGMRVATEAALCREMEICYCSLCFIIDYAEGRTPYVNTPSIYGLRPADRSAIIDARIAQIFRSSASPLAKRARNCPCANALVDLRTKGALSGPAVNYIRRLSRVPPDRR